jgi:hypothetical protein
MTVGVFRGRARIEVPEELVGAVDEMNVQSDRRIEYSEKFGPPCPSS